MSTTLNLLLFDHDTVECAYYLRATADATLDFEALAVQREQMRQSKSRDPRTIKLGNTDLLLHRSGSSRGYPFIVSNADWTAEFGEYNNPSFYVTFRSEALWRETAAGMHAKFMAWADSAGLVAHKSETLSRVDFAFDYHLPVMDFDEENVVTLSAKDGRYRNDRKVQTLVFGRGDVVLRIYDKVAEIAGASHKTWFFNLWGMSSDVWRIEWQVRKAVLRRFGIRTLADLADQQGDVLRYLATEHDSIRVKTQDVNRSRWPLHPLWIDLQGQISRLNAQGIYREIDPGAALDERMMRMAVSIYGYLKTLGAIYCIQHGESFASKDQAAARLKQLLDRVHDPFTWKNDVQKRIDLIRLGQ